MHTGLFFTSIFWAFHSFIDGRAWEKERRLDEGEEGGWRQQMVMGDSCVGHMFHQLSYWSAASRQSDIIFI